MILHSSRDRILKLVQRKFVGFIFGLFLLAFVVDLAHIPREQRVNLDVVLLRMIHLSSNQAFIEDGHGSGTSR
jgi:hypothetical protein